VRKVAWAWLTSRFRRPVGPDEWGAAAIAALFGVLLVYEAIRALIALLLDHWYLGIGTLAAVAGVVTYRYRWMAAVRRLRARRLQHLRLVLEEIDRLSATAFEYAVRDLMIRDGIHAERVGGADDKAADVIGRTLDGQVIMVQCKHTKAGAKVSAPVIYQVNGTVDWHGADIAVVVTNGSFTNSAAKYARDVDVRLIGRDQLQAWAQEGVALQELLKLTTSAGRRRLRPVRLPIPRIRKYRTARRRRTA